MYKLIFTFLNFFNIICVLKFYACATINALEEIPKGVVNAKHAWEQGNMYEWHELLCFKAYLYLKNEGETSISILTIFSRSLVLWRKNKLNLTSRLSVKWEYRTMITTSCEMMTMVSYSRTRNFCISSSDIYCDHHNIF